MGSTATLYVTHILNDGRHTQDPVLRSIDAGSWDAAVMTALEKLREWHQSGYQIVAATLMIDAAPAWKTLAKTYQPNEWSAV